MLLLFFFNLYNNIINNDYIIDYIAHYALESIMIEAFTQSISSLTEATI